MPKKLGDYDRDMHVTIPQLKPAAASVSHVGNVRKSNEDSIYTNERLGVFAVADGMGGHAAGEVASKLALQTLAEDMNAAREMIFRSRFGQEDAEGLRKALAESVRRACKVVYDHGQSNPECAGMGCTLTILLTLGEKALMAHVGDSRLYLWRDDYLHQLSSDFTMAAELVRAGAITPEQAERNPWSHQLTRAVGLRPTVRVETLLLPVVSGDRFLVCSDGVTGEVDDDTLCEMLGAKDASTVPQQILDRVLAGRARDNTSCIVVEVQGNPVTASRINKSAVAMDKLRSTFLCDGLVVKDCARVLAFADLTEHEAGEELFGEGEQLEQFIMCVSGKLTLQRGDEIVSVLEAGDYLGETTLIRGRPARSALVATEQSVVLELSAVALQALTKRYAELGIELVNRLALRLSRLLDQANLRLETMRSPHIGEDPGTTV